MTKDDKIVITDTRIAFKDDPNMIIMDEVERPLMKKFAEIVTQNGGDILEVGFGMGISANYIYESNINTYTCIELHPEIYERALVWASDKPNVKIILGNWVDVIPEMNDKFDGIFMDTFEFKNYDKFEDYCKTISKDNCVLSIFNYTSQSNKSLDFEDFKFQKTDYLGMRSDDVKIFYSFFDGVGFTKKTKSKNLI